MTLEMTLDENDLAGLLVGKSRVKSTAYHEVRKFGPIFSGNSGLHAGSVKLTSSTTQFVAASSLVDASDLDDRVPGGQRPRPQEPCGAPETNIPRRTPY